MIQNTEHRTQNIDKFNLWFIICGLLSFFILAGCITTSKDLGKIQWDINELRSEIKDTKQKVQSLEDQKPEQEKTGLEIHSLYSQIKSLGEEQKATGKAASDLLMKVQSLSSDVQVLTGRVEEVRHFSEQNLKGLTLSKDTLIAKATELEIMTNLLKEKLDRLEASIAAVERQKTAEDSKKAENSKEEKKEEKTSDKPVKDAYMEAYDSYSTGKFNEAREKFYALLKDFPENEYSDNARFWIAESYYKEKNYEDAILAYEELLKKNPKSDKASRAMLNQGLAFYELKDEKTGKIILEKLINRYPDSEEAKLAKKKIDESTPAKPSKSSPKKKNKK